MRTKLFRSEKDKMLGGVCGGLGQYLGIDSTFVRLFFVFLGLAGSGVGLLIYLVLWIILPVEGQESGWQPTFGKTGEAGQSNTEQFSDRAHAMGAEVRAAINRPHPQAGIIIGGALILLGIMYLVENLHLPWLQWFNFDYLWPLLLVIGGVVLLLKNVRQKG
jgi:phage shock protein C